VDEFVRVYETLLAEHEQVLSIHLSAELSQTAERAREAVRRLDAGDRILVVDSRLAGAALGLLCLEARARLDRGATPAEAAAAVAEIAGATRIYFSVYSLDFLYLGGRLERVRGSGSRIAEDRPILALERPAGGGRARHRRDDALIDPTRGAKFGVGHDRSVAHAGRGGRGCAAERSPGTVSGSTSVVVALGPCSAPTRASCADRDTPPAAVAISAGRAGLGLDRSVGVGGLWRAAVLPWITPRQPCGRRLSACSGRRARFGIAWRICDRRRMRERSRRLRSALCWCGPLLGGLEWHDSLRMLE
jgi:hypothetical protein